jgi:hypothetical protein
MEGATGLEKNISAQERKTTKKNHMGQNCSEGSEEKRKREETAEKRKKEEELKRKELERVDREIRELQARRMQIARVQVEKGAHRTEKSPRESFRGDGSLKRGPQLKNLAKVKQVSGLANSKVNHAALLPAISSDASRGTSFPDPLLLGVLSANSQPGGGKDLTSNNLI